MSQMWLCRYGKRICWCSGPGGSVGSAGVFEIAEHNRPQALTIGRFAHFFKSEARISPHRGLVVGAYFQPHFGDSQLSKAKERMLYQPGADAESTGLGIDRHREDPGVDCDVVAKCRTQEMILVAQQKPNR